MSGCISVDAKQESGSWFPSCVCECLILDIYPVACVVNEVSMNVDIRITDFEWYISVALGVKISW